MAKFIIKRILLMIPVIIGVSILIFTILYFVPGDPATVIMGSSATEAELQQKRIELGLDQSYFIRLMEYMKSIYLHFDFGRSYISNNSITSELITRMPRTLIVGVISISLSLLIGVPLGINAAVHQNGVTDRLCMFMALFGVSMPTFWVALMLVIIFALNLGWLPSMGIGGIEYYILPCVANSFNGIATQARQARSSMLEVIRSDFIITARSKGLSEHKVIYNHALPNALIPIITVAGGSFATMFGGSLIIETIFSIPGVGIYMITAVNSRDYPVVMGCVIFLAITFGFMMLLVDLAYAFIDPRIKAQYIGNKKRKGGKKHG
ncbi:MAG: ABC transporter permease [Mobilitalea sp.]